MDDDQSLLEKTERLNSTRRLRWTNLMVSFLSIFQYS